jgi:hypothetical protein
MSFQEFVMTLTGKWFAAIVFAFGLSTAFAQDTPTGRIPKVSRPPKMQDFLDNVPREAELKITDFRQFDPGDGDPVSQPTTAYLSYDQKNLYVAFICIDDPSKIRAHITRRDSGIFTDDWVDVSIDTFHDHRRNFGFTVNPYGIQMDYIHSENTDDDSFDTLWYSEGKITTEGYVVFIAIPFKSLRFPHTASQEWGILLSRFILRNNESSSWPYVTRRLLPSWTGQFGHLKGLENISPGRNIQFIPYGMFSANRFLDPAAAGLTYRTESDARAGVDTKMILRLRVDETYLYSRLASDTDTSSIFNNHIFRSKFNYQFSREFSLRAIVDYNAILPNSSLVSLERTKRFGLDFLFTYLLHPGTAVYVGYTDIYENLHLDPYAPPNLQWTGTPDTSVGRQFFVKLSYLLRM